MRLSLIIGVALAVALHAGFILFGGLLIPKAQESHGSMQEVELIAPEQQKEDDKPQPEPEEPEEELAADQEQAPDAADIIRNLETPTMNEPPALDAASLSAIEAALSGQSGLGSAFATGMDFTSGGRIGGTGKGGGMEQSLEGAFNLNEIDQKPRVTYQSQPLYPAQMRGKKVEGVVVLIFVVDASGKVVDPRVERSNNSVFDKPAMDAIKRWKFEPAVKGGQRVACKVRQSLRFKPS